MPRPLILLIAFSVFSATVHGQEAKRPSPAVTRILDEAVRAVKRNRVDFDKSNQKPLGEARKALEDLSTKLIKDGKADEAAAVLRQVGTLEADVMKMANAPAPVAGGGAVPQKPLLERMAGKWDRLTTPEYLQVTPNGSVALVARSNNTVALTGTLEVGAPDIAQIQWRNGFRWELRMAGEDLIAVSDFNPDGKPFSPGYVLQRMK